MRVLLTGTAGQVGGALLPLLRRKYTVIAPSIEEFDLSEPESLSGKLDVMRPNLIVNPAAHTAVDKAEDEPVLALRINGEAPAVLARWAADHRVPLVHFSTDYVFDGSGSRPWREDDPPGPLSIYGRSKLAGENAVRTAGGAHLVVRTAWVYAAEGANFMRTIIRLAAERDELRVVADQFGAPTSAASIASAVATILERAKDDLPAGLARADGLVHVTNSGSTSWCGFAEAILGGLRARGLPLRATRVTPIGTQDYPTKTMRPANSRMDLTRLKTVFDIEPQRWEQALSQELDAFVAKFHRSPEPS